MACMIAQRINCRSSYPGRNSIVIESSANNPGYNFIAVRERDNPAGGTQPPKPASSKDLATRKSVVRTDERSAVGRQGVRVEADVAVDDRTGSAWDEFG